MVPKEQWTLDTLYLHLNALIETQEKNLTQHVESQYEALRTASANIERRFDSVNAFRAQLADQQHAFIPRAEVQAIIASLTHQIETLHDAHEKDVEQVEKLVDDLRIQQTQLVPISLYETRHADIQRQLSEMNAKSSSAINKGIGVQQGWAFAVAAMSMFTAMLAIATSIILHFLK